MFNMNNDGFIHAIQATSQEGDIVGNIQQYFFYHTRTQIYRMDIGYPYGYTYHLPHYDKIAEAPKYPCEMSGEGKKLEVMAIKLLV